MRFWFRRSKPSKASNAAARKPREAGTAKHPRPRQRRRPADDDPIKNWETNDQAFLRQAGDPFDG